MSDQTPTQADPAAAPMGEPAYASKPSKKRSRVWSNLNLNGPVPARVRPAIGEWGPERLPSTKQKKRMRWIVPIVFVLAMAAVTLTGWYFWTIFR